MSCWYEDGEGDEVEAFEGGFGPFAVSGKAVEAGGPGEALGTQTLFAKALGRYQAPNSLAKNRSVTASSQLGDR